MNKQDWLLAPEEVQIATEQAYKKACDFADRFDSGLASKWFSPCRPADRRRYFNEHYQLDITTALNAAQQAKTLRKVAEWSRTTCPHVEAIDAQMTVDCPDCWKELLDG